MEDILPYVGWTIYAVFILGCFVVLPGYVIYLVIRWLRKAGKSEE